MSAAVWHGRASLAGLATPRALYHDWLGEGMRVLWLDVEGMHAADLWKDLSQGEARVGGRRGRHGPWAMWRRVRGRGGRGGAGWRPGLRI